MGRLEKPTTDFLVTTITAIIIAAIDTCVILFPQHDYNRVVVIGIVTFFGLLIVSAHHEFAKKRAVTKKEKNQFPEKPDKVPDIPTSLSALPGDSQISLSWNAPSDSPPIEGYQIYRGTASGSEPTLIATKTSTSYVDRGLTNNTSYYYKILAYNSVGHSDLSTEAGATPMTGKGSTSTRSDDRMSPTKWDGEIMRTSIAGTLILLYVIVIAVNVFPTNNYIYTCESASDDNGMNSTSIANKILSTTLTGNKISNGNTTTNTMKESTTCKSLLDNFGQVIIVVIGFYFGSKAAIQIYQNYKGSQSSNSDSGKT